MATEVLAASAVSGANNWNNSGGANRVVSVALPDDDDTTYISSPNVAGTQQQYAVANPAVVGGSDTINSVTIKARTKGFSNTVTFNLVGVLGASNTPTAHNAANAVYGDFTNVMATKPGGGAWTLTDLQNLEIYIENTQARVMRCTSLSVIVDYTVSGGGANTKRSFAVIC